MLGKPNAKTVHLITPGSHLREETECGLKKWKQATVAVEWATCVKCLKKQPALKKLKEAIK